MIIGEFTESNFDNYEEDGYDYMLKPKSKPRGREKRALRKENKSFQKGGLLKGNRKHPLLGNFGMFDKKKRKGTATSSDTIQVGVQSADMNVDTPPLSEPDLAPTNSTPAESIIPGVVAVSNPNVPGSPEVPSDSTDIKVPSSAINAIVSSDNEKTNKAAAEKTNSLASAPSKEPVKEDVKKSNVKEAGFSSMLGFAFLGVAIILAGFALFRADQKSRANEYPLKQQHN
jgi:hypothetical protein